MGGGNEGNRLGAEKSPYLLQHASNPVDWYPWGPEAFARAKREDKPVFLSIGYSTCHWCHVMAHESFEDPATAKMINEVFIPIKVDREERPDLDGLYMKVCQSMTGRGGWPLTILMTPEKKPFFAGTYLPRESRAGMIGLKDLVPRVDQLWKHERKELEESAEGVVKGLGQSMADTEGDLGEGELEAAYLSLKRRFDDINGGFGGAPKFPTPHNLLLLLRYWRRRGEPPALEMVERTLKAMRRGGIFDQIGLGFHRYSTDAMWLVPHFEKMLYDQALIAEAYVEAFQATHNEEYASTAKEVIEYVLRDLLSPEGAFYSAEDADSEGEEGKYYVWTQDEVSSLLEGSEAEFASRVFGITEAGNFEGTSILHIAEDIGSVADSLGYQRGQAEEVLEGVRKKLLRERSQRIRPSMDDKILLDWNSLMVSTLAKASRVLRERRYLEAGISAMEFILDALAGEGGRLLHRYREGEAAFDGTIDDYAFLLVALLDLYEASFESRFLESADRYARLMISLFWDEKGNGLFVTPSDGEELLVRQKEAYDGALPSGNSMAMLGLLRLGRMLGDQEMEEFARRIGRAFGGEVAMAPSGFTRMLAALDHEIGPSNEIVLVGDPDGKETGRLLRVIDEEFHPNKVVLLKPPDGAETLKLAPYLKNYDQIDGKATAYVCSNYACSAPTTDPTQLRESLAGTARR